jgi:molecular chaperone GrpE
MSLARNWKEKIKKSFNMENTVDKEEKEMTDELVDQTEGQAEDQKPQEPELTVEEKLLRQNEELNDKYLRLMADFENYKRNAIKDKMELAKTANKDFMMTIVSLLDDFERGMANMKDDAEVAAVKEGVDLIYKKFIDTLGTKGLKQMESKAIDFNADLHEAIAKIPAPSEDMKGKNIDEVEKGYYLNDVIIRHAKVVVGE